MVLLLDVIYPPNSFLTCQIKQNEVLYVCECLDDALYIVYDGKKKGQDVYIDCLVLLNLGNDLGIAEQKVFLDDIHSVSRLIDIHTHIYLSTHSHFTNILYLTLDLDSATTERRKNDLVTSGNLQRNVVTFLVQCTLTNGKNNSLVGSFLSLLGNKDTRGSFLTSTHSSANVSMENSF